MNGIGILYIENYILTGIWKNGYLYKGCIIDILSINVIFIFQYEKIEIHNNIEKIYELINIIEQNVEIKSELQDLENEQLKRPSTPKRKREDLEIPNAPKKI